MDTEKIIFLIIAIALSIFSMYRKAKKQKEASRGEYEESEHDFLQEEEPFEMTEPVVIFKQQAPSDLLQKSNFSAKKAKKQQNSQTIEATNLIVENTKKNLQDIDLENEITLLEDFEGTEIQKAFLYSEIFKNAKN
jgi:hypothetical protein